MSKSPEVVERLRVLVRVPNPVGDLVMSTASLLDLRRHFADAHITLLLRPGRDVLLEGLEVADEVVIDDSHKGLRRLWRLAARLRAKSYDLAINFTNSLRSALVLRLAGVGTVVGYRKGGQTLLLDRVVEPVLGEKGKWLPRPMSEIYADLCAAVDVPRGDGRPRLVVPEALEERARSKRAELGIAEGERLIGLAPGASFGASKLWPPPLLAELADRLHDERGLRSLLLVGPGEQGIAADLLRHMRSPAIDTSSDPLGLDLLKPFIRDLALLVTMDSGPRHYGAALGVPTLVVMGPTDPRWTNSHLEHTEVVRHDVECGPCHLTVCPLDHRCLRDIRPDEVIERIAALEKRLAHGSA